MKVTIEVPARRGHWVAYVEGPDPKYGLALDFSDGQLIKSRHVRAHVFTKPAFVAIGEGTDGKCSECGSPKKIRSYYMVTEIGTERIPSGVDLARITAGPRPGENGAYGSTRCACGKDATTYDSDGMPFCDAHRPGADIDESQPCPA